MPVITSTYKDETFEANYIVTEDGNGKIVRVGSNNGAFPSFEFYISPDGGVHCPDYSIDYSDKQYDDILLIGNDIIQKENLGAGRLCR